MWTISESHSLLFPKSLVSWVYVKEKIVSNANRRFEQTKLHKILLKVDNKFIQNSTTGDDKNLKGGWREWKECQAGEEHLTSHLQY